MLPPKESFIPMSTSKKIKFMLELVKMNKEKSKKENDRKQTSTNRK